jgi:hypothetical protein
MAVKFNSGDLESIHSLLEEQVRDSGNILSLGAALNEHTKLQTVTVVNWTNLKSNSCTMMMDDSYIALYVTGPGIEKVMINLLKFHKELECIVGDRVLADALLKYNNTKIE